MPYWPNCGLEVKVGDTFCLKCGQALSVSTVQKPTSKPPRIPKIKWILLIVISIAVTASFLFIMISDIDLDGLIGYEEIFEYGMNPFSLDSDSDGLPDNWEIDYAFNPTNSYDASEDPDYDGLTNFQEYQLGTITKNGSLYNQKDLFIEIDYFSGYTPSTSVIEYLISYSRELNTTVNVLLDDEISWNQLTSIGLSPNSLTSTECSIIENNFHDYPSTHIYVFYAKTLDTSALGWASEYGAFIDKEKTNSNEGFMVNR